jgi:hypothetical protein
MSDTVLNEFDKNEWYDVCRALMPGLTEEEYDALWADFQAAKAAHKRQHIRTLQ